jgi:hypothetical protein
MNHIIVHFQTRAQQSSEPAPANAPSTGMTFTIFPLRMSTGIYSSNLTFAEETIEEQLVDVPVVQQASPSEAELPIPVEISSSSPSAEAIHSPEMNLPNQPEPPSPPRAQSPVGHAETTVPTEVDPTSHQPEAQELPAAASTPPSSDASALLGTPPSPVIAPAQETSHEVSICA